MKMFVLAASFLVSGAVVAPLPTFAHGGKYTGPGDTVPGGGYGGGGGGGAGGPGGPSGPSVPGPNGPFTPGGRTPGAPGGSPGGGSATGAGDAGGSDLTQWNFWWELNKEPLLDLRAKVRAAPIQTGSDGWFLGEGRREASKDTFRPSDEQIRGEIVPALLQALAAEKNNDIVTGCLIALAKIGDGPTETGASALAPVIARFLSDNNQEIRETAAVALGILAHPQSIGMLEALMTDHADGRKLVGQPEVDARTRAFAAYGLGLIGSVASDESDRQRIVSVLRKTLETDTTHTRDLKVGCVIAFGLVPLETIGAASEDEDAPAPPESSRVAQLDYLVAFLADGSQNDLVRAHCPAAMARLVVGLPPAEHALQRERIARALLELVDGKNKEHAQVVQSAIYALGLLGTNDGVDPLDKKIRATLAAAPKDVSDQQARNFAMIALAKVGSSLATTPARPEEGIDEVSRALLDQLANGKSGVSSWAGLACGILASRLDENGPDAARIASLQGAVRTSFREEKDPSRAAAFAVAAGIMGDVEAAPFLLARLADEKDDDARGYIALGLGLMNAHGAVESIQGLIAESKYRPELLKQAAIALGLLGDKHVVPQLIELLQGSKSLASQAAVAAALGFIGDGRSVDPLIAMLKNQDITERARGFAAAALGIIGDEELLPWNTKIGLDLNYRASTQTLTDQSAGTGILDIL